MTDIPSRDSAAGVDIAVIALPFGRMELRCDADRLLHLAYVAADTPLVEPRTRMSRAVADQLRAYCADPRHRFDLPLAATGTAFQNRVWALLRDIPAGTTLTYGEAATRLGSAARAVGQACAANPFAPIVPCHRVVARNGLGGFAHSTRTDGYLLHVKRWLLRHEGVASGC